MIDSSRSYRAEEDRRKKEYVWKRLGQVPPRLLSR